ncbi:MAG: tryptophan synthase subunit alpha [Gammaproteobacteria bacterium]|nr:tryptophan synthase subunit alpha [Gammaproteobacteria bacterium]
MSRLAQQFASLKKQRRAALIPYVMAGDPAAWATVPLMHALVRAGASVIELGVPFSDPMADGPVIQRAGERALKNGISLRHVLDMVREFRTKDTITPVVLMGYLNPIECMGYEAFATEAADAGVDAAITVDLPPEEAEGMLAALRRRQLDAIFLLAPTSGPERIAAVARAAGGFIYYVSLRGVTGASHLNVEEVKDKLHSIRRHTDLPVGVGFGISDPETAARVAAFADAVVVGSAVVSRMEQDAGDPERMLVEVPAFVARLRAAMDASQHESRQRTDSPSPAGRGMG